MEDAFLTFQARYQDPQEALHNYLAVLSGARGEIPAVMGRMARQALAHLRRADVRWKQIQALFAWYRERFRN